MPETITTPRRKLLSGFDPLDIIRHFYPDDTPLRRLLLKHGRQVRDKALAFGARPVGVPLPVDTRLAADGAMLHDIGIGRCRAPKIRCTGTAPYLAHGIIGGEMLRDYGRRYGLDLEPYARICERHIGTGITASEVRRRQLPIPERDYLPETPEEQLICLADKFFSKSGDMKEKTVAAARDSVMKFGIDTAARFDTMCRIFGVEILTAP
ncbi:MAG: HD domain-containing protein [Victivallales bacterium]|nr:HD domain-containing protein [Victivallales bacterium]